jgi:hypothetical protein
LHILDKHLKPSESAKEDEQNFLFEEAYRGLSQALSPSIFGGALQLDGSCDKIARGALALYGMDQIERAKELLSVIMKRGYFESALRRVVRAHFNTPTWTPKF